MNLSTNKSIQQSSSEGFKYGDVDNSGYVDIVDALLTAQFYVGLNPATFTQKAAADVDDNGFIDINDARMIAQYYVGVINSFPAEENMVFNGHFHDGDNSWGYFQQNNGNGSMAIVNGELKAAIINGGDNIWDVGIAQTNFNLETNKRYTFKFKARTTSQS